MELDEVELDESIMSPSLLLPSATVIRTNRQTDTKIRIGTRTRRKTNNKQQPQKIKKSSQTFQILQRLTVQTQNEQKPRKN